MPTAAPTNISATASGLGIAVSWSAPPCGQVNSRAGLTGYEVRLRSEGIEWRSVGTITNASVMSVTITSGIIMLVVYELQVAAVNGAGVGVYSSSVTASVVTTVGEIILHSLLSSECVCLL